MLGKKTRKIVQVIGTRPQLIKVIPDYGIIVNTGQHWDKKMNDVFEEGLKISYHLNATTIDEMVKGLRQVYATEEPDIVIVYGDTRSTLAGCISAKDMRIKVAHVEAGVRCFDDSRPEEVIRKTVDHSADLLLCPTKTALMNLEKEGLKAKAHLVGDTLYDRFLRSRKHDGYILLTLHRAEHVDNRETLQRILNEITHNCIWPMHPRTRDRVKEFGITIPKNIKVVDPFSYDEMQEKIAKARLVMTDSGGVIRETYWRGVPLKVIGGVTEWPEVTSFGTGNAGENIKELIRWYLQ